MSSNLTVREIIALWPSRAVLAEDIHSETDPVTLPTIHKWAQRNSIPPRYQGPMLRAACARGITLTADTLVMAHDRQRQAQPRKAAA
ncbi:MAG: hypothetical protein V4720_06395 [Pseudomonadota bacterium]